MWKLQFDHTGELCACSRAQEWTNTLGIVEIFNLTDYTCYRYPNVQKHREWCPSNTFLQTDHMVECYAMLKSWVRTTQMCHQLYRYLVTTPAQTQKRGPPSASKLCSCSLVWLPRPLRGHGGKFEIKKTGSNNPACAQGHKSWQGHF